jgi:hypothetical protein
VWQRLVCIRCRHALRLRFSCKFQTLLGKMQCAGSSPVQPARHKLAKPSEWS